MRYILLEVHDVNTGNGAQENQVQNSTTDLNWGILGMLASKSQVPLYI